MESDLNLRILFTGMSSAEVDAIVHDLKSFLKTYPKLNYDLDFSTSIRW